MQREVHNWIKRSGRRKKIISQLKQPMTAKQLAKIIGIRNDCCSYVLQEFLKAGLVVCLNPQAKRSRLYWLTHKGIKWQQKLLKMQGFSICVYDFPAVDWSLYGWVCYNHRSAVLKALTEPSQPITIRKKVIQQNPDIKISANNVSDVLQLFVKERIIKPVRIKRKARPAYRLTGLGKKLQLLLCQAEKEYPHSDKFLKDKYLLQMKNNEK